MGCEFGQEREWNHDRSLDWHLLEDPHHEGVRRVLRDLNALYRTEPALHQRDCGPRASAGSRAAIPRTTSSPSPATARTKRNRLRPVERVSPVVREGYRIGVPKGGTWVERLNTDARVYGGSGTGNSGTLSANDEGLHGYPASLSLTLPPLATIFYTGVAIARASRPIPRSFGSLADRTCAQDGSARVPYGPRSTPSAFSEQDQAAPSRFPLGTLDVPSRSFIYRLPKPLGCE